MKNLGSAAAAMKMNNTVRKYARGLTKKMEQIENKVHQAMAVMDKETGQLLNYRQMLHSAKYKKQWSISSANKFGRLANNVGNRIKNPTNTILDTSKGSQTIQARETQTATLTIPQHHHQIWGKDTICHCAINLTAVRQTRQEMHPTSVWQILVFVMSSQWHTDVSH
jgi:hypothetical protein